jgi:methionyl-tRNA synthetase
MLLSAGLPLPKTIFAHGWWLSGESKMSKSVGNVINPLDLIEEYGVDPVRYYLMREMVLGQDANFTMDSFIKRYNSDLANDFGNLLNRISTLIHKNYDGIIPQSRELTLDEKVIKDAAGKLVSEIDGKIKNMKINEAIEDIMQFIRRINKYMEEQAPWKLVKENKDAAGRILYTAGESLRIGASLLSPVMPNRTSILLEALNTRESTEWGGLKSGSKIRDHQPLFPRIQV